jgi:hypothetical protein
LPNNSMLQALHVLLPETYMMLLLSICCCRRCTCCWGGLHDAVANHLLLQALHVLLLEECMMLLQRQGEKFLLKFHSSSSSQAHQGVTSESKRHFHSPIIKVGSADIFGSADISCPRV